VKKLLTILALILLPAFSLLAQNQQDENQPGDGEKIGQRMNEYVQDKLGLSKNEADRFNPVFIRYYREFVATHRTFKDDNLILKQKIIELRLRYRTEFRQILDEQRANKVFVYEDKFRRDVSERFQENRRMRMENRPRFERPFRNKAFFR
jgi:hypothetical protein